jgi:serine-type D-Ala-D-Ala carboxypeptidase (penicillin-binding protein 5/6)
MKTLSRAAFLALPILLFSLILGQPVLALNGQYKSAILMDSATGEVLYAENEHQPLPPASMVKMLTELIILEHVASGEVAMDDMVEVSAKASNMGGSQVYLKHREQFPVEELLRALAIHSANDAAVALAEFVAGSTDAFVELMNMRAAEMGMQDSEFHFVHGLPPAYGQSSDLSSAYDMALLGREIAKHPQALTWATSNRVPFRNGEFILTNPNPLVGKFRGLEGIKTGFTSRAGHCLTAAATQKNVRLISVVMGSPSNEARGLETTRLLSRGFSMYTRLTLVSGADEPIPQSIPVSGGKIKETVPVFTGPLVVGVLKTRADMIEMDYVLPEKLKAPVEAGQIIGKAVARLDGRILGTVDIKCSEAIAKGSFWERLLNK